VLIGYMRISKADGSQVFDLQRDALLAARRGAVAALSGSRLGQVTFDLHSARTDIRRNYDNGISL
jgi:hypothetical protein